MARPSCLGRRTECFLLVLVVTGLSVLPPVCCQYCNTVNGEPLINISSTPPSNKLPLGGAINLTCTAWQTDELAKDPTTRPHRVEWFDPQDKRIGIQYRAGWPPARLIKCTVEVGALTNEKLGNYTCRAINGYNHCSTKRFQVDSQQANVNGSRVEPPGTGAEDTKSPEFVNVPVNQAAFLGSNVTFYCAATGYPRPTITWLKDNGSGSVQYNPTAKILTGEGNNTFSRLVFTEVKSKDYGIYYCVANNSAGVKISSAALVYRVNVNKSRPAPHVKRTEGPSTTKKKKNVEIIAITVSFSVAIMSFGAVIVFLHYFRGRRLRNKKSYMNVQHDGITDDTETSHHQLTNSTNIQEVKSVGGGKVGLSW